MTYAAKSEPFGQMADDLRQEIASSNGDIEKLLEHIGTFPDFNCAFPELYKDLKACLPDSALERFTKLLPYDRTLPDQIALSIWWNMQQSIGDNKKAETFFKGMNEFPSDICHKFSSAFSDLYDEFIRKHVSDETLTRFETLLPPG